MRNIALFILACFCSHSSIAQLNSYKKEFRQFIPAGWLLDTALKGDLNKDMQPDVVLVLRNTLTANFKKHDGLGTDLLDLNPRRLLILFKTGALIGKSLVQMYFCLP